jgi:O-antigen/teichoic acid export membrane protein
MRRMFSYGSRAQVGSILQIASGRVDVIIIEIYRPLSQVGYYVVAQTVAQLVLTLAQEFRWTSMVLVTKYEGDARQARTSTDSVRHYGIAASAAVICNAAFGSALILVAYGHQYEPAVGPMLVLLPGMWFLGMSIVIQGDLDGRGRPGLSSRLAALAAGVTVAFDLALIPPFGVIGAAIASVFANSIYGVASVTALRSVSGIPVRELVVPRRDDLASYWRFAMRALRRLV